MTIKILQRVSLVLFVASFSLCAQAQASSSKAKTQETNNRIFVFYTDEFWLNLHHFLYVLGRAENKERDTAREAVSGAPADQDRELEKLSAGEQKIWRDAVAAYAAGPSKKDVVFDDPMPAVTNALARAGDSKSIGTEVDSAIVTILQRAAPIYRKAWWSKHRDANRNWQKSIEALVDRHGDAVLAFITRSYQMQWPSTGFPVHVSAYSNWAGAYSTTGNLLVMSSLSPSLQGLYGFETAFHEGMHQWDEQFFEAMRQQAIKANKFFPRGLSHAIIFFTAGEAVRHVVDGAASIAAGGSGSGAVSDANKTTSEPAYVPYAEKFGVWQRGISHFKAPLEEIWKPYLHGKGTRDEALAALVTRTAVDPPKK